MVRETRMDKSSLIYPLFVMEGTGIKEEIPTMPGQYRYSIDQLPYALEELVKAGVGSVMFFGIPDHKDECGSGAYAEDGIVQKAEYGEGSTTSDAHLYAAARNAALKTRFNMDANAPAMQQGTITYYFKLK